MHEAVFPITTAGGPVDFVKINRVRCVQVLKFVKCKIFWQSGGSKTSLHDCAHPGNVCECRSVCSYLCNVQLKLREEIFAPRIVVQVQAKEQPTIENYI